MGRQNRPRGRQRKPPCALVVPGLLARLVGEQVVRNSVRRPSHIMVTGSQVELHAAPTIAVYSGGARATPPGQT